MLKWAVNQPRPSYLAKEEENREEATPSTAATTGSTTDYSEFHALRGKLRRKSLAQGKENHLTSTPLPAHLGPRTPCSSSTTVYASTLPTFEAEYSPSGLAIPGPLLALRGLVIPDSYFEKPRYLEQKPLPPPAPNSEQATLSSSQMGDVTLELMIDAILESTRKPAPVPANHQRLRPHLLTNSPTYRPAFDPASDLREYWQPPAEFEEREVCSPAPPISLPPPSSKRRSLQLRRQRVVRRKRKITHKISSSVRQSAQKLLAAARSTQKLRHISPDSGHNSTSDCELEVSCHLDGIWLHTQARDVTKRRLSFSLADGS